MATAKAQHGTRSKPSRPTHTPASQRALMLAAPSDGKKSSKLVESPMAVIASLRAAMLSQVTEEDVRVMMQTQIEKAKEGDKDALRFVFEFVLGGKNGPAQPKKAVQNNYYLGGEGSRVDVDGAERPTAAVPTPAKPGTSRKLDAMRERVARGVEVFHEEDEDLGDDE